MLCPTCKTVELVLSERQGIEIDYCPTCRGVWLDRGELDKIIERSTAPASAPAAGGYRDDHHRDDHHRDDHHGHGRPGHPRSFWRDLFD